MKNYKADTTLKVMIGFLIAMVVMHFAGASTESILISAFFVWAFLTLNALEAISNLTEEIKDKISEKGKN